MQLGTRWILGDEPPARLPDAVITAIREVESAAGGSATDGEDSEASYPRRWTLTWLEGRPRVELDPAEGSNEVTVVHLDPGDGTVLVTTNDPDDEWVED